MTKRTNSTRPTKTNEMAARPVVISTGCPRGIGPEVSILAAHHLRQQVPAILVGDRGVIARAAARRGLPSQWIERGIDLDGALEFDALERPSKRGSREAGLYFYNPGPALESAERLLGRPTAQDGQAQLAYIEAGFALCKARGLSLVTGPVSKEVIAHCGLKRAAQFRGHTEWLEHLDGAPYSVMCFQSERLTTSLVTTHVPIKQLSRLLTPELVRRAVVELYDLLVRVGKKRPSIAVCSLNPHAGEGELLGSEERTAIVPGTHAAQAELGRRARVIGPIGAETAYRKAAGAAFDGVVAIYHDQATIPMKLLAFGDAVNVTQGLSIVRTSVDHGTAYDIAKAGIADEQGMISAIILANRLAASARRV